MTEQGTSTTRSAYIVTSHPDGEALSVGIAERIADSFREGGGSARITNLPAEDFAPAYDTQDITLYRDFIETHTIGAPGDAVGQQEILDEATDLVFVFPVYWWSMPAQLKGWVDRVFTGGWAWGAKRLGRDRTSVSHLTAHVVAITGAGEETFSEAGYDSAMRVQIEDGIFRYCGFGSTTWSWIWDPARAEAAEIDAAIAEAIDRIDRG